MKCRDIEVGTTILTELDPTLVERIMAGVEKQSKEYSKLSSNMGRILTNLTRIQHDNQQQPQRQQEPDKEPKIKKELCPDIRSSANSSAISLYTTRNHTWNELRQRDRNIIY